MQRHTWQHGVSQETEGGSSADGGFPEVSAEGVDKVGWAAEDAGWSGSFLQAQGTVPVPGCMEPAQGGEGRWTVAQGGKRWRRRGLWALGLLVCLERCAHG